MELLAHSRWLTIDATSIPTSPLPPGIFSNTRNGVNTSRPGNHNGKQPVVVVLVLILLCHFGLSLMDQIKLIGTRRQTSVFQRATSHPVNHPRALIRI